MDQRGGGVSVPAADMAARLEARLAGRLMRRESQPGGLLYGVLQLQAKIRRENTIAR